MERAMASLEISFGQGGYQPTEFIKRHLPDGYFDLLIIDEGHEYKNDNSAQGQAMGVLANKVRNVVQRCMAINAAAVIFAHNHPSGISEPSHADKSMTARLKEALNLIDVRVLDHIVVGSESATSFTAQGLL
jgi:DNA repair protein RadC